MLWKRHLSVYSQTYTKENKKDSHIKQTSSLIPIQTPTPIIYETL